MTLPGYIYRLKAGIKHYILEAKQTSSLLNNLREANLKYGFALDAGQLATLECDLITRKVTSNARLKEWLGVPLPANLISIPGLIVSFPISVNMFSRNGMKSSHGNLQVISI